MKIACVLIFALLAAAADGFINFGGSFSRNGNGYASSQLNVARPYGGRYGGSGYTNYNGAPSAARAQSYYPNVASSNNPIYQANTYNSYPSNTYNPYPSNTYNPSQSNIYNPSSQFVGSPLASQYLASLSSSSSQPVGNVCPSTTSRTIIISDYIKYGVAQTYPCIGACVFQPNAVLNDLSTQNYDKSDVVVVMVGPYSYPKTAFNVLNNATMITALATRTNLYLTTIPVRPTVKDAATLAATASANALVRTTASATPSASLLDYQTFYNSYVVNIENQWGGIQMCDWLRDQIPASTATVTPATPTVPGTLAPF